MEFNGFYNKKHTEETKQAHSKFMKEWCSKNDTSGEKNSFFGKKHTEESRKKMGTEESRRNWRYALARNRGWSI